jgi:uncharacterized glyoxalase superfamily protein PhnB
LAGRLRHKTKEKKMNEEQLIPIGHQKINPFFIIKNDALKFIEFTINVFNAKERREVRTPDKDGKLIHAEIQIGDSTIMMADSKEDWPFTPSFVQIYINSIDDTLEKARNNNAKIITEKTQFYGGYNIGRIQDPFGNIWWLYEKSNNENKEIYDKSDTSWHDRKPSYIYKTLIDAMMHLK